MSIFKKNKKVMPIPDGFSKEDIRIESSICTGERTIGFYNKTEKKLMYAELINSDKDINAFYEKYGVEKGS